MYIAVSFISGVMLGIEVLWEGGERAIVLDLGIVRIYCALPWQEEE